MLRVDDQTRRRLVDADGQVERCAGGGIDESGARGVDIEEAFVDRCPEETLLGHLAAKPLFDRGEIGVQSVAHGHAERLVDQIGLDLVHLGEVGGEVLLVRQEVADQGRGLLRFDEEARFRGGSQLTLGLIDVREQQQQIEKKDNGDQIQ